MDDLILLKEFGKRNRLLNFAKEIREMQKLFPNEVHEMLDNAVHGVISKSEQKLIKNYDNLWDEHHKVVQKSGFTKVQEFYNDAERRKNG